MGEGKDTARPAGERLGTCARRCRMPLGGHARCSSWPTDEVQMPRLAARPAQQQCIAQPPVVWAVRCLQSETATQWLGAYLAKVSDARDKPFPGTPAADRPQNAASNKPRSLFLSPLSPLSPPPPRKQ